MKAVGIVIACDFASQQFATHEAVSTLQQSQSQTSHAHTPVVQQQLPSGQHSMHLQAINCELAAMSLERPEFMAKAKLASMIPSSPTPPKTAMNLMVQFPSIVRINKTVTVVLPSALLDA